MREKLLVNFSVCCLLRVDLTEHLSSSDAQLNPEQCREEGARIHTANQTCKTCQMNIDDNITENSFTNCIHQHTDDFEVFPERYLIGWPTHRAVVSYHDGEWGERRLLLCSQLVSDGLCIELLQNHLSDIGQESQYGGLTS